MVTNAATGREAGRPRRFENVDVFSATSKILAEQGLPNLTLHAIATEIGCTPQALIRRFGSRRSLLLAHLTWVTDESAERFAKLRARFDSPLEALRTGYIRSESPDALQRAAGYANLVIFGIEASQDPELRRELRRREQIYHQNLAEGVRLAIAAGELAGCDPDDLAFLLLAAGGGVMVRSASNPDRPPAEQITRVFDALIHPFQTALTTRA
jgi:AcrR family transcriptional regulator